MKRLFTFMLALVSAFTLAGIVLEVNAQEASEKENIYFNEYSEKMGRTINFDDNWKFYFGDLPGAQQSQFDDSKWRSINLPHDYSIEQEFSRKNGNEGESGYLGGGIGWYRKTFHLKDFDLKNRFARIDFDGVYMNSDVYINGTLLGNHPYGYTPFSYDITKYLNQGENTIAVRVNHQVPSSRWYSGSGIYRSVNLTLGNKLHVDLFGSKVIAPALKDNQDNVELEITTDLKNKFNEGKNVTLEYELFEREADGSEGKRLASYRSDSISVNALSNKTVANKFNVQSPKLWSVDEPNLYLVKTKVYDANELVDTYTEDFGFRYFTFDPVEGFSLNGERMKLKGVSMHHDQGSLGAVANKDAQERQIRLLKEMGANAIRVTHNPASQTLIDAANEMGILLIEEAFDGWDKAKNGNTYDYSRFFNQQIAESNMILGKEPNMPWSKFDLKMQIKRGASDPAIIAWSLGNEIWEGVRTSHSDWPAIHRDLISFVKALDTSRPITTGDNKLKENNSNSIAIARQNAEAGGIVGFNYASGAKIDEYHKNNPSWPIYASETSSAINSRGVYHTTSKRKDSRLELTSYDNSTVNWGLVSSASWDIVQKRDYIAGEFIWTGFDYLGEPTDWNETDPNPNGDWPAPKNSFFGILDTAGLPKDRYYFYQSQWNDKVNTLHVLPAWDKKSLEVNDGDNVRVDVYSDAYEVRLFLDKGNGEEEVGRSSMSKHRSSKTVGGNGDGNYEFMAKGNATSHTDLYHSFNVRYNDGTLIARAYDSQGREIKNTEGISVRKTTGNAYKIKATVEDSYKEIEATNKSLAYIRLDVVDKDGNIVPYANNLITTRVSGEGSFISMDNGKQADLTKFSSPKRAAYNGSAIAIVAANTNAGEIKVEFSGENLISTSVTIKTKASNKVGENTPIGVNISKNYFIKVNGNVTLPNRVELLLKDGTTKEAMVEWSGNDKDNYKSPGIYRITGLAEGHKFVIYVNVIDTIAGLISYSTNGSYGEIPELPKSLEAFDAKGNKLGLNLDVEWNMPGIGAFERRNTVVKIKGTASFLGQEVETYATVSLRDKKQTTANIAPEAMKKSDDRVRKDDYFEAMFNKNNAPGSNFWSNYTDSQNGDTDSIITLEYATKTKASSAKITFVKDTYSLVYPRENDIRIEYLEGSLDSSSVWQNIDYTVSTSDEVRHETRGAKTYTYNFNEPVGMTYIRFIIKNNPSGGIGGRKVVTAINELELMGLTETAVIGNLAGLEALSINGYNLTSQELNKGYYNVTYNEEANLKALGAMNAAVTVLPKVNNKQIIQITSEDKRTNSEFVINYGVSLALDPNFSGADYNSFSEVLAPAAQNDNLAINKLYDNKEETYYHSAWNTNLDLANANSNNAIILTLEKPAFISGLRYLPRKGENVVQGERNGRILRYEIEVAGSDGLFNRVAAGSWANNSSWKIAEFNNILAYKVKLIAKESFGEGDQGNKYINASEIRLVQTDRIVKNNINEANVIIEPTNNLENPIINVMLKDKPLNRNHDYTVSFKNIDGNRAKAIITGINEYSGTKEVAFELNDEAKITDINLVGLPKNAYIGDIISTNDIEISIHYSNGITLISNSYILANRISFGSGFNEGLGYGYNQLSFTLDNILYTKEIFAMRGSLDKAYSDALARFDIDTSRYENVDETMFKEKLDSLKSLNKASLEREALMKAISECEKEFNKLVAKSNAFSTVEAKASLVLSYNPNTLTANKINLRFGGKIEAGLIDSNKEYGVIVVATNRSEDMKLVNDINNEKLELLKAKKLAYDIKPIKASDNSYQFAWVIDNIPQEKYDFEFKAFLYEKDSDGNIALSKEKVASVNTIINSYIDNKDVLSLPLEVVEVLKKLQQNN